MNNKRNEELIKIDQLRAPSLVKFCSLEEFSNSTRVDKN